MICDQLSYSVPVSKTTFPGRGSYQEGDARKARAQHPATLRPLACGLLPVPGPGGGGTNDRALGEDPSSSDSQRVSDYGTGARGVTVTLSDLPQDVAQGTFPRAEGTCPHPGPPPAALGGTHRAWQPFPGHWGSSFHFFLYEN